MRLTQYRKKLFGVLVATAHHRAVWVASRLTEWEKEDLQASVLCVWDTV